MVSTQAFQGPYAVRVDAFFSMQTAPWVPRTRRRGSPATHFPSKPKNSNFQAFPNLPGDKGVGKTNLLYTMTSVFFHYFFHVFEKVRNITAIRSTRSKGLVTKFCFSVVLSQAWLSPYGQPCTLMNSPPGMLQPQVAEHNILAAYPLPQ